jgi:hypothetical protein
MANVATLALGLQGCEPRGKLGSHAACSWECKRVWGNRPSHTPKGTPTLGVGVSVDSWMFRERLQGLKFNGLRKSFYHWKAIKM